MTGGRVGLHRAALKNRTGRKKEPGNAVNSSCCFIGRGLDISSVLHAANDV